LTVSRLSAVKFLIAIYSLFIRRILPYISPLVAKSIATAPITIWFDNCNSRLYNIASKDILKLLCVQNCLALLHSLLFCPISDNCSLAPCPISFQFQSLQHCLWKSLFQKFFVYIFHAFSSIKAQKPMYNLVFTCCCFLA